MAFGGVLTGKWKDVLIARAAGRVSIKGCTLIVTACGIDNWNSRISKYLGLLTISLNTGISMLQMATFAVTHVQIRLTTIVKATQAINGMPVMKDNESPSILAIPLTLLPSASAKPPPKSKQLSLYIYKKKLDITRPSKKQRPQGVFLWRYAQERQASMARPVKGGAVRKYIYKLLQIH